MVGVWGAIVTQEFVRITPIREAMNPSDEDRILFGAGENGEPLATIPHDIYRYPIQTHEDNSEYFYSTET